MFEAGCLQCLVERGVDTAACWELHDSRLSPSHTSDCKNVFLSPVELGFLFSLRHSIFLRRISTNHRSSLGRCTLLWLDAAAEQRVHMVLKRKILMPQDIFFKSYGFSASAGRGSQGPNHRLLPLGAWKPCSQGKETCAGGSHSLALLTPPTPWVLGGAPVAGLERWAILVRMLKCRHWHGRCGE